MNLKVNGIEYTNFTSASCDIRLDALSSAFAFEAVAPKGQPMPFQGGELVEVTIDGEVILTGFIETISVDYSATSHTIGISGRDKTADLIDSTLGIIDDTRGEELTLKLLIEKVIKHLGLDIKVIDEVNPAPFNSAEDVAAPEPGDNAFGFIEGYARKRQVLLTSDGLGNVVIAKNTGISVPGAIQNILGATDNNVISSSFSYDLTGRYRNYKMASSLNPTPLNNAGDTALTSLVNQGGGVSDTEIRQSRQLVLISETSSSSEDAEKRATWEANVRKSRSLVYAATVDGYRVGVETGALWQTNRLYQITDNFVGKVEQMLCNSIGYTLSIDGGRTTSLGFVGQNAYTQSLEENPVAEVSNVQ